MFRNDLRELATVGYLVFDALTEKMVRVYGQIAFFLADLVQIYKCTRHMGNNATVNCPQCTVVKKDRLDTDFSPLVNRRSREQTQAVMSQMRRELREAVKSLPKNKNKNKRGKRSDASDEKKSENDDEGVSNSDSNSHHDEASDSDSNSHPNEDSGDDVDMSHGDRGDDEEKDDEEKDDDEILLCDMPTAIYNRIRKKFGCNLIKYFLYRLCIACTSPVYIYIACISHVHRFMYVSYIYRMYISTYHIFVAHRHISSKSHA
jgi:hypothetical protein